MGSTPVDQPEPSPGQPAEEAPAIDVPRGPPVARGLADEAEELMQPPLAAQHGEPEEDTVTLPPDCGGGASSSTTTAGKKDEENKETD